MKKQKMFNRVSSFVLAVVMVLGLCVSPASSQQAKAGDGDDIAGAVEEVPSEGLHLMYGNENLADEDAFVLLVLGDGFTKDEQQKFYLESKKTAEYIMKTAPYDEFEDVIKIYAYGTVSNQSGARADKAATQDEADKDTRDTYFSSSYWNGGMQRLLYPTDAGLAKVEEVKNQVLPEADFCSLIVNSSVYGGSGGDVFVASLNESSLEMMLHEMGHTVGGLSDEYWPGGSYAAETVNMSAESNPQKVRWARFVGKDGVGVYENEQNELAQKWYRPSQNCKMRYLSADSPFCAVCQEVLRQEVCKYTNVTKLFFQPYADEFFESSKGTDMSKYFIIRRNGKEVTGDQLGDKLKLVYKTSKGEVVDGIPSKVGTYTIEASYDGDDTFEACNVTAKYEIQLPDLITLKVPEKKVYNGKAISLSYSVKYNKKYTTKVRFTGTQYKGSGDVKYNSSVSPVKPGKYTVEVKAYDKASGKLIAKKSKSYEIKYKKTKIVNNDSVNYPGANDVYSIKHIVIVGEGFTKSEQAKFEKAAKEYAQYFLNMEPVKEVQSYFDFTTVETVSNVSGIGTKARNTYFGVKYDKNGRLVVVNKNAPSDLSYYNVSQYRAATVVIVNDKKNVKKNAVTSTTNTVYGTLNSTSKKYVANELLNILTGKKVGYRATTASAKKVQRTELLDRLYFTWSGYDYAVITGKAYAKKFVAGKKVNMDGCFKTYILGKEYTGKDLKYKYTYYDSKGKKLSGAPSKAGTYKVVAELIPTTYYACDEMGTKYWEVTEDQFDENWQVLDESGNVVGYYFGMFTPVEMDGTRYLIPASRGTSTFTISPAKK